MSERPPAALVWTTRLAFGVFALLIAVRLLNAVSMFPRLPADTTQFARKASALADTREVHFAATDGTRLYGWVTGRENSSRKILFFCGNGGNVSGYGTRMAQAAQALGAQALVFDYRGYYLSEGSPSEEGCKRDARGAWLFAARELGWRPEQTIIWGHSLGAAFAVSLALDLEADESRRKEVFGDSGAPLARQARALILEAPFTSVAEMAKRQFGFLLVPHWLVYADLNNLARVPALKLPILVMHGTRDEIIPFDMGQSVAAACNARTFWIEGGDHNGLWDKAAGPMTDAVARFLE